MEYCICKLLIHGPAIIEAAHNQINQLGLKTLSFMEWSIPQFPSAGFHIDVQKKQLIFWAADAYGMVGEVIAAWPGWEAIWLEDRFEAQLAVTRGQLTFLAKSDDELLSTLERSLLHDTSSGSLGGFLNFVTSEQAEGKDVKVNPNALIQNPLQLSNEIKRQIYDAAVLAWKKKRADRSS